MRISYTRERDIEDEAVVVIATRFVAWLENNGYVLMKGDPEDSIELVEAISELAINWIAEQ